MTEEVSGTPDQEVDLPEQIEVRLAKRDRLNELGDAYPVSLPITTTITAVRAKYPDLEIDVATGEKVGIAGRVMFQRNTGKLCFASLQAFWLVIGASSGIKSLMAHASTKASALCAPHRRSWGWARTRAWARGCS